MSMFNNKNKKWQRRYQFLPMANQVAGTSGTGTNTGTASGGGLGSIAAGFQSQYINTSVLQNQALSQYAQLGALNTLIVDEFGNSANRNKTFADDLAKPTVNA